MARYKLGEWEINGYSDSDWMVVYYDDRQNKLGEQCVGSTRYGGCSCHGSQICYSYSDEETGERRTMLTPNAEVVEKARVLLEEHIFTALTKEDENLVMSLTVEQLEDGLPVQLKEAHKNQIKAVEPCGKCSGSGKWINPRNEKDVRECFACHGTGSVKTATKVKTADGKVAWNRLPVGLRGIVVDFQSHGQFYRNGYNQPDAHNTTVKVRSADGKVWQAPLYKLRLQREPLSSAELRARARQLSYNRCFGRISARFTWLDVDYTAGI
jgi:hypothetical protein